MTKLPDLELFLYHVSYDFADSIAINRHFESVAHRLRNRWTIAYQHCHVDSLHIRRWPWLPPHTIKFFVVWVIQFERRNENRGG